MQLSLLSVEKQLLSVEKQTGLHLVQAGDSMAAFIQQVAALDGVDAHQAATASSPASRQQACELALIAQARGSAHLVQAGHGAAAIVQQVACHSGLLAHQAHQTQEPAPLYAVAKHALRLQKPAERRETHLVQAGHGVAAVVQQVAHLDGVDAHQAQQQLPPQAQGQLRLRVEDRVCTQCQAQVEALSDKAAFELLCQPSAHVLQGPGAATAAGAGLVSTHGLRIESAASCQ